ncbi:hypothetical protein [Brevundimonas sp.]|uniref:hypothetical protein n=1 Tax=Brevundimonas sp. TaxID=1871086 RepID=UPI003D09B049
MEELIVTQGQGPRMRPGGVRDALNAYQTAAWRTPAATRFDSRPANDVRANDFLSRADAIAPTTFGIQPTEMEPLPRWIVVAVGCVVAALMGALLGGMMSV